MTVKGLRIQTQSWGFITWVTEFPSGFGVKENRRPSLILPK